MIFSAYPLFAKENQGLHYRLSTAINNALTIGLLSEICSKMYKHSYKRNYLSSDMTNKLTEVSIEKERIFKKGKKLKEKG